MSLHRRAVTSLGGDATDGTAPLAPLPEAEVAGIVETTVATPPVSPVTAGVPAGSSVTSAGPAPAGAPTVTRQASPSTTTAPPTTAPRAADPSTTVPRTTTPPTTAPPSTVSPTTVPPTTKPPTTAPPTTAAPAIPPRYRSLCDALPFLCDPNWDQSRWDEIVDRWNRGEWSRDNGREGVATTGTGTVTIGAIATTVAGAEPDGPPRSG